MFTSAPSLPSLPDYEQTLPSGYFDNLFGLELTVGLDVKIRFTTY